MSILDNSVIESYELDIAAKDIAKVESIINSLRESYCQDSVDYNIAVTKLRKMKREFEERFHFSYESFKHDNSQPSFMNAKEARELYNKVKENDNTELEEILKSIKEKITINKEDFLYIDIPDSSTIKKLKDLGYNITYDYKRIKISF